MTTPIKRKEAVQPQNKFYCVPCDQTMDATEIKAHLTEIHGVKEFKGTKKMRMHMDGADWYSWEYEWDINGVALVQSTMSPRRNRME